MSTTATTAPAALTILSQLLLSISLSFAPGALLHGARCGYGRSGAQALLGRRAPTSAGTRRDLPGPPDRAVKSGATGHFGYARPMPGMASGDGDRRLIEAGVGLPPEVSLHA